MGENVKMTLVKCNKKRCAYNIDGDCLNEIIEITETDEVDGYAANCESFARRLELE